MKLRKLFVVLLALLVVLSLAGCGGGGGGSDDPAGDNGGTNGDNGGNGGNGGGEASATPWLCFKATGGDVDVKIKLISFLGTMSVIPSLEWSNDGTAWTPVALSGPAEAETTTNAITTLTEGTKMYLRATSTNSFITEDNEDDILVVTQFDFSGAGNIEASGNVMSLLDKNCSSTTISSVGCFRQLFKGCTKLVSSPELPATTLTNGCYEYMFEGCTALTAAPELPATTLANGCYDSMFAGCTALTAAPELPATTLKNSCYAFMFNGCSNLSSIKVHFINNDPFYSTFNWLDGVTDSGTFECPSACSLYTDGMYGTSYIPNGWNVIPF